MLDRPYSDEMLQRIARENNLSETAYLRKTGESWHLRWFTLNGEIDLCGHATMAAAYAVMELIEPGETQVRFDTLSGRLTVDKTPDGLYAMDFPAYKLSPVPVTDAMEQAIGARPAVRDGKRESCARGAARSGEGRALLRRRNFPATGREVTKKARHAVHGELFYYIFAVMRFRLTPPASARPARRSGRCRTHSCRCSA